MKTGLLMKKRYPLPPDREAGIALIYVLFIMVIAGALSVAFLQKASIGNSATSSRAAGMQAQYLAESAANHAMWRLMNEPGFPASPDVYYMHSLAGGRYGYKVRRHTSTTFAAVATVGTYADQVAHQSYVLWMRGDALAYGLIGYWRMDEADGITAYDTSGNGRNGTLTNMDPTTDWVPGKTGNALDFDGSDDFVSVAHQDSLSMTGNISVAAWVTKSTLDTWDVVITKGSVADNKDNFWFGTSGDEIWFGFYRNGTWYRTGTSDVNLPAGTWYHLAATYNNASRTVLFYKDGLQVGTGALADDISKCTNSGAVTIGNSRNGEQWEGKLDDVRLYGRVLSPAEILRLYQKAGS